MDEVGIAIGCTDENKTLCIMAGGWSTDLRYSPYLCRYIKTLQRKMGRPQLRWEDCVKGDVRKAEEGDKWGEKAVNRGKWRDNS